MMLKPTTIAGGNIGSGSGITPNQINTTISQQLNTQVAYPKAYAATQPFDIATAVKDVGGKVEVIDRSLIPADISREIDKSISTINFNNPVTLSTYGTGAQKEISTLSAEILSSVKTKDTGDVGVMLGGLIKNIKDIDPMSLSNPPKQNFIDKMMHKVTDPIKEFAIKQKSVESNITTIVKSLEAKKNELYATVTMLAKMFDKTVIYFKNLQVAIIAGHYKLQEERATTLVELQQKAETTKDATHIQQYNDYKTTLEHFEKRLYDMTVAKHVALLQGPQIKQLMANSRLLAEQIQSSILTAIPAWNAQMVMAISAHQAKKGMELQNMVTETINSSMQATAKQLGQLTVDVATMSQKSVIGFETVMIMQIELLDSIDKVKVINEEGRKTREENAQKLLESENELKARMMQS